MRFFILLLLFSGCLHSENVVPDSTEIHKIPIKVVVGSHLGVDVTKKFLSFGTIPPGSSGKRWINFTNIVNVPRVVHIDVTGNVSDWLYFPENDFLLKGGQTKRLEINIKIPKDAHYGSYTGMMILRIKDVE
jgi:uncharacterized membrane protein